MIIEKFKEKYIEDAANLFRKNYSEIKKNYAY